MGILDWFTKRKKDDDIFSLDDDIFKDDPMSKEDDVFKPSDPMPSTDPFASPEDSRPQPPSPGMIRQPQKPQQNPAQSKPYESQPIQSPQLQQQQQTSTPSNGKDMENLNLKLDMLKMMITNLDQKITRMESTLKQQMDSENRRKYY